MYRQWHKNNWAELIKYITGTLGYKVIIVCSDSEKEYARQIADLSGAEDADVLAGLPVMKLLAVLKCAKCYIGQDSGIFHVAAALNIRCLCLSAGNAYFRFMNYPKNRKNIKILFPRGVEEWIIKNNDQFPEKVRNINAFFINSLKISDVIEAIHNLLLLKDVFFINKFRTKNTGDREISPLSYFKEYFSDFVVQKFDNEAMPYLMSRQGVFILGGGGLINQNENWNNWMNQLADKKNSKVIGWGIGFNQHFGSKINSSVNFEKFSLLGVRDFNKGLPYLPCVSCLKKELNKKQKIKRKIGCIIHYENSEKTFDFQTMFNNQPFDDLIEFISTSEVIITNTYHMMYWATLMQKKVILFNPFSDRFCNFKYPPIFYSGDLQADIEKAKTYPNALRECRDLNMEFFEKVKRLIEDYNPTPQ